MNGKRKSREMKTLLDHMPFSLYNSKSFNFYFQSPLLSTIEGGLISIEQDYAERGREMRGGASRDPPDETLGNLERPGAGNREK